jgi:hypothetical protein
MGDDVKQTHPTHDELVSWLDGTLLARRKKFLETHMSRGCASCQTKADAIRATLGALSEFSLAPEIPGAAARTLARIRELAAPDPVAGAGDLARRAREALERVASLVFDSWRSPAPAGARAASPSIAAVRQLIFEREDDRYTVRVTRSSSRAPYQIIGQLLMTGQPVDCVTLLLRGADGRAVTIQSEDTGEFFFEDVPPGEYTILIRHRDGDVVLPGIDLP